MEGATDRVEGVAIPADLIREGIFDAARKAIESGR